MLILWHIWASRNDAKHRKKAFNAHVIILKTLNHLHTLSRSKLLRIEHFKGDFTAAKILHIPSPAKSRISSIISIHWAKPAPGWVKLNSDGASRVNPRVSKAKGIVRDHLGMVIFAFFEPFGHSTNMKADLQGLLKGLQLCFDRGLHTVWIELDAMQALNLISASPKAHGTSKLSSSKSGNICPLWKPSSNTFTWKEARLRIFCLLWMVI
ncbi:UNVERIFIED_CONTAM: putative ribonuclease H protein [Sesamum latifolium]|uniref:Ribonuclease H protein n=1 Tax=Sesamum latifolium TaxID=2727402 RepID=A0AAW2WVL4_9LAMI